MKKILCLILCLISVVSCCSMTISAASETATVVENELAQMTVAGEKFSEANYPVDTENSDKYVITVFEKGFKSVSSSSGFGLYVYIYNPNCEEIKNTSENSIQIGINLYADNYYFYGLSLMSKSEDNRFLKYMVVSRGAVGVNTLFMMQEAPNERVYNIGTLRLSVNDTLTSFHAKKSFLFTGYDFDGSLQCQSADLYGIDVKMYDTNWISPNAGFEGATMYDHYELASVYFTLPKSLFAEGTGYDYIESIRADFMKYQCTPIIVTRPGVFDQTTITAIEKGTEISLGGDTDVMDLWWNDNYRSYDLNVGDPIDHFYSESKAVYNDFCGGLTVTNSVYHNYLAYYFESTEIPEDFEWDDGLSQVIAVSAEKLKSYFYERYNDPNYDNSKLYTSEEQIIADYNSADLGEDYLYNMSAYMSNLTSLEKWLFSKYKENDAYIFDSVPKSCNKIDVITDPLKYVNVSDTFEYINASGEDAKSVADKLFIGVNDVEHFSEICNQADQNNEYVVLLRFGFSEYSCVPVIDIWEKMPSIDVVQECVGFAIEKTFYRSVNLLQIVFSKDEQSIVVPVCSNTVDVFGDLVVTDPDIGKDLFPDINIKFPNLDAGLKNIGKIISTIAVLAVILIAIAVFLNVGKRKNNNQNDKSDGGQNNEK